MSTNFSPSKLTTHSLPPAPTHKGIHHLRPAGSLLIGASIRTDRKEIVLPMDVPLQGEVLLAFPDEEEGYQVT